MFSKKIDFTDNIQYKLGERIENLKSEDYTTAKELITFFEIKNNKSNWKYLHFLNSYYLIKKKVEEITKQKINSNTNLNKVLDNNQKNELEAELLKNNITPIERIRKSKLNSIVFTIPPVIILGPMLLSTYYITAMDYSGWLYLSGLVGLILSFILVKMTKSLKKQLSPNTLLAYSKSTYVVRHKTLQKDKHTPKQIENFILDELKNAYNKNFSLDDIIPEH